jgi:hypothetical protein
MWAAANKHPSACIASGFRIMFVRRVSVVLFEVDVSYNALFVALLTEIEAGLGLLAACSLCFPRLFKAKWAKAKQTLSPSARPTLESGEK